MSHSVRCSMKGSAGEKVGCKADWRFSETVACLKKCPLLGFTYWMHIRVWVGLSADVRWQWPKLICQDCEWGWLSFLCELTVRLTCHLFTDLILLRVTSDNLFITLSQPHGMRRGLSIIKGGLNYGFYGASRKGWLSWTTQRCLNGEAGMFGWANANIASLVRWCQWRSLFIKVQISWEFLDFIMFKLSNVIAFLPSFCLHWETCT